MSAELYRTGILLAKKLGKPVSEVPKPFQLNELEDWVFAAQQEVAAKAAVKRQAK